MSANKEPWWVSQFTIPAYPRTYLDLAQARGAELETIAAKAQLDVEALAHAAPRLNFIQFANLVNAVVAVVGDDGLGTEVGFRLPPTVFGNLGYAMLCSATVGDAIRLCLRFHYLITRGIDMSLHVNGEQAVLEMAHKIPLPEPIRHLSLESMVAGYYRGCQLLANTRIDGEIEVWFKNPAPSYADFMRGKYSALRFDMPVTQLRFPAALLQAKLAMHNPTGLAFAIRQCEQENALQAESALKIRERVRREVVLGPNGYPSQAEVAQRLKMTTRTMRRHLDKEGVKFSELLDQAKRRDAIRLLDDSEAEIQNVAAHLGYQEPANFTRAFRQWTGQSPSEYRQTRKDSR